MVSFVRVCGLRTGTHLTVAPEDRRRLGAIISHPATPQKHVWRCRIVVLSGDGLGTMAIVAATGTSKQCVRRWQERFASEGVDGLKHGVFHSVVSLQEAINSFIKQHNETEAKPFTWCADPDEIIAARNRGFQMLESIH